MVAAHDGHHDLLARHVEERLEGRLGAHAALQEVHHLVDGVDAGGVHLLDVVHRAAGLRSGLVVRLGDLDVGGVFTALARDDGVLAVLSEDLELGAGGATHGAGVRLDDPIVEAESLEDPTVGVPHGLVALHGRGIVDVEAVGILHQELAAPEQPRPRARLVAILHLYLIEVDRELSVALHLSPDEVGDDLLVGGPEVVVGALPVLEAHQRGTEGVPAPALLEVGRGEHRRHEELLSPGGVHLLADDGGDPMEDPHAERQKLVDPGADHPSIASAEEQDVRGHRRVLGRLFDGGDECLRVPHGGLISTESRLGKHPVKRYHRVHGR